MYNDRLESNQLQKGHITDYTFLQLFIYHGASAVFYNDYFPVKFLNIGKGLYQDGRFLQIFLIIFSHFSTPLLCKYRFFHLSFCNLR